MFTPKIRGKVKTRGGMRKGIMSQPIPRLLTSDAIFNIKIEQEKARGKERES